MHLNNKFGIYRFCEELNLDKRITLISAVHPVGSSKIHIPCLVALASLARENCQLSAK